MNKLEICANCEGHGKHSKAIGVITSEDRLEWSDEEFDAYLGGAYDRLCEVCKGFGKVSANENRCEKYYATDEEYFRKREGGY
jgi:RecJ-like exonuclease